MDYLIIISTIIIVSVLVVLLSRIKYLSRISKLEGSLSILKNELLNSENDLINSRTNEIELNKTTATLVSEKKHLQEKLSEQKESLENLQEKFTKEFENLANRILDEKSSKFTIQNKENIEAVLKPLNSKIIEFEKKVSDIHINDSNDRAALKEQIKNLSQLNQQMSQDADNLTKALKGDSKAQGTWGEFILEKVLEKSGLVKGQQYAVQESHKSSDGKILRPDVIIYLPDNKNLIVDSKVSLTSYERYSSADNKEEQQMHLKAHILSLTNHIKELSAKNYQNLYGLNSPDFVLMFIPVEPAFGLAVQKEPDLFYKAFDSNIVVVSPSTLLATLRTIESIWKQENQNRNALEIAKQSGDLYDKFVGFVNDLVEIGKKLKSTDDAYQNAMNKLSDGKGNLVKRAEKIKQLGAKTTKSLPNQILDKSLEE